MRMMNRLVLLLAFTLATTMAGVASAQEEGNPGDNEPPPGCTPGTLTEDDFR